MAVKYVGPYHGIAYDIANQWAESGQRGFVGPYAPQYYDAAEAIMAAQNTGDQTLGASTSGASKPEPAKVLNQAAVDNTNKAIDSLSTEEQVGRQNIADDYGRVIDSYDSEFATNKADYDEGIVTNNQNREKGRQNALVAAAQGLRGLRGVLGSIGALSGDGSFLANRAVTAEANQDIGGVDETAATNARGLDKSWGRFKEEDKQRRADAQTSRDNSITALEGSIASKKQGFFQKLAELFGDVDNTGKASEYLNKAGDLNTTIAQKGRVKASPITRKGAAYSPAELETYLAGVGDMTVDVQNGGVGAGGPTAVLAGQGNDDERKRKLSFAS